MMGLAKPVAVAAHDAGAANILLAWLEAEGLDDVAATMAGPAVQLWKARFPGAPLLDLEDALSGSATLLSGTGWSSTFEHDARRLAKSRGIRSVAVVDHWANYRERFRRDGEEVLPDEVWVTDAYALAEARRALPEVAVRVQPNRYLAEQAAAAGPRPENGDLLFVAEPARGDWGAAVPGEFQSLDYLVTRLADAGIGADVPLRVRPHPSDPPGKYDAWIATHPGSLLDEAGDVAQALSSATWVAGLQSFAMVIALEARRIVLCALPPNAPPCALPHEGIVHLRQVAPR